MADVKFYASLDTRRLDANIKKSTVKVGTYTKTVTGIADSMDRAFKGVALRLVSYGAIFAGLNLVSEIVKIRGEFQQLRIAFETMLDSKEKADRLIAESIELAQRTPFTLLDVTKNTKQLLAMGVSFEKVMGTLVTLGDVAAGVSVPLQRIAINYGQVITLGRLQAREIRDFAMAGVPLVAELAKNLDKSKAEILSMVQAGQLGAKEVEQAFQTMAGAGGKFFNLMEKQNKSVTGQISNLVDKWQVMLNTIGTDTQKVILGTVNFGEKLIANYKEIGNVILDLIIAFGLYKAALIITRSIQITNNAQLYKLEANALNQLITVQGKANVSKLGLTIGTVKHTAALRAEALAQLHTQRLITIATIKEIRANEASIISIRFKIAARQAELVQTNLNITAKRKKRIQTEISNLTDKKEILISNISTQAQKRKIASTTADTIAKGINTAGTKAALTWTNLMTGAQIRLAAAFNKVKLAMLSNPWTAIAIGVAAVTFGIYKLVTASTTLELAQDQLNETFKKTKEATDEKISGAEGLLGVLRNEESSALDLVKAYDKLIERYKFFKGFSIGDLQKLSTKKFKDLFADFSAGTELDSVQKNYDDQLAIVTRFESEIKRLQTNARTETTGQQIKFYEKQLEASLFKLREFQIKVEAVLREQKEADILALPIKERNEYYQAQIDFLNFQLDILNETSTIDPFKSFKVDELIVKIKELRRELIIVGGDVTVKKQIEALDESIKEKRALLIEMRKDESTSTKAEIIKEEKALKAFIASKAVLTGEDKKALKDAKRLIDLKLKYELDSNNKRIKAALDLRQSLINIQKDGVAKERLQIELDFDRAQQAIQENRQKQVIAFNKANGFTIGDKGFSRILSKADEKSFLDASIGIEKDRAAAIVKINEDAQKEIDAILSDANNVFLNELNQKLVAIENDYQNQLEALLKLTDNKDQIAKLEASRDAKIEKAKIESALRLSDFYKDLFGDLELTGDRALRQLIEKTEEALKSPRRRTNEAGTDITVLFEDTKDEIELTDEALFKFLKRLGILKKEYAERRPFKGLADAIEDIRIALKGEGDDPDKDLSNAFKALEKSGKEVLDIINEWGESLGEIFGEELSDAISKMTTLAEGALEFGVSLAKGDPVGMISSGLKVISSIVSIFGRLSDIEKEQIKISNVIDQQNFLLERQIEILKTLQGIDRSKGEEEVRKNIQAQIDGLNYLVSLKPITLSKGGILGFFKETFRVGINSIEELIKFMSSDQLRDALEHGFEFDEDQKAQIDEWISDYDTLIDKQRELAESLTQTTGDAIASGIVDGFAQGKTSQQDFADSFEELMKDAIIESFKTRHLLAASKEFFDDFSKLSKGGLTDIEIEDLRTAWSQLQAEALSEWQLLVSQMGEVGIDLSGMDAARRGLQAAIRREMTEETGSKLTGIIRKQSDDTREIKLLNQIGVTHLMNIEKNTSATVDRLDSTITELKLIVTNTTPAQTTRDLGM